MIGVFIDTFVVLTMTALVVISTLYAGDGVLGNTLSYSATKGGLLEAVAAAFPKANLAQMAFGKVFGETFGNIFVAVCLFFFAFSTILSWNFFGKINFQYLFGKKYTVVYTAIAVVFVFLGSIFSNDLVWELTDFFNYLMVLPNVIALVALGSMVVAAMKEGKEAKAADAAANAAFAEKDAE